MQNDTTSQDLLRLLSELLTDALENDRGAQLNVIDSDASLTSFGLDSLMIVNFVVAIEEKLDLELEPELAFQYPTINALSRKLETMIEKNYA